ncbi:MAG TPA: hypothetical protein ENN46_00680 [Candidatus Woesearchaeota archaeon]|nr:hypothetical protein [Candidatus Woesearchaeota archaeon]
MQAKTLLQKLQGVHTIESIKDALKTNREKAIYYVHRLRKKGYVKTKRQPDNTRVYYISPENRLGGKSYYELINESSPLKVADPGTYRVYGKELKPEDALIYAISSKSLRLILASLALFRKVKDWGRLYSLARENNTTRQVAALYDLARTCTKVKKAPKRFLGNCLPKGHSRPVYIIPGLSSDDFKGIEKKWKVFLPFNKKDLEEYR